jgi:hypothetical protein
MTDESADSSANDTARADQGEASKTASSDVSPIEARARRMGWIPETEWDDSSMKRRPKKFLPAEDYIENVEANIPVMRERLRNYDQVVERQQTQLQEMSKKFDTASHQLTETSRLVEDLYKQNQEIGQRAYDAARRDLEAVKRRAVSEADEATYEEADRRIAELEQHRPKAKQADREDKPATQTTQTQQPQISQAAKDWIDGNKEIMNNPVTNAAAVALHTQNMASGMSEDQSLAKLTEQVKKEFPHRFSNGRREEPSAVAGSSPPPRQTKKQTFDALPADAKDNYERLAKFFERQGKTYTREQYAKTYYYEQERPQ